MLLLSLKSLNVTSLIVINSLKSILNLDFDTLQKKGKIFEMFISLCSSQNLTINRINYKRIMHLSC